MENNEIVNPNIENINPKAFSILDEKLEQATKTLDDKISSSVKVVDPIEQAYNKDKEQIEQAYKDNPEEAKKHLDLLNAYRDFSLVSREKENLLAMDSANRNVYEDIAKTNEIENSNRLTREFNTKDNEDESWSNVGKRALNSVSKYGIKTAALAERGIGTVLGALTLSKGIEDRFNKTADIMEDSIPSTQLEVDNFWIDKYNKEAKKISDNSTGWFDSTIKGFKHGLAHPFTSMADSTGPIMALILTPEIRLGEAAVGIAKGTGMFTSTVTKDLASKAVQNKAMDSVVKEMYGYSVNKAKDLTKYALTTVDKAAGKGWILAANDTEDISKEYKETTGKDMSIADKLLYFSIDSVISGADFDLLAHGTKDVLKSTLTLGKDKAVLFNKLNIAASQSPTIVKAVGYTALAATQGVKSFSKVSASMAGEYTQEFLQEWHDYNVKNGNDSFAKLTGEALNEIAGNAGSAAAGAGVLHGTGKVPSTAIKSLLGTVELTKSAVDYTIKKHKVTSAAKIVDNDHLNVKNEHNRIAVEALRKANKINRDMYNDLVKTKFTEKTIDKATEKYADHADTITNLVQETKMNNVDPETVNTLKTAIIRDLVPTDTNVEDTTKYIDTVIDKIDNLDIIENTDKKFKDILSTDTKKILSHVIDKIDLKKQDSKMSLDTLLNEPVNDELLGKIKNALVEYNTDLKSLTNENDITYNTVDTINSLATKYKNSLVKDKITDILGKPLTKTEEVEFKTKLADLLDKSVFTNNQAIVQLNSLGRPIKLGETKTKPIKIAKVKVHNNTPNSDIISALSKETKDKSKDLSHNLSLDKLISLKDSIDSVIITEKNEEQINKTKAVINKALNTKIEAYNTLFGKKDETLTLDNINLGDTNINPEVIKGEHTLNSEEVNPTKIQIIGNMYSKITTDKSGKLPSERAIKEVIKINKPGDGTSIDLDYTDNENPIIKANKLLEDIGVSEDTYRINDNNEAIDFLETLKKAREELVKDKNKDLSLLLLNKLSKEGNNIYDHLFNDFNSNPISKLQDALSGKLNLDTTINRDNIYLALKNKQPNLSEDSLNLITKYMIDLIENHPSILNHPIVDPLVKAFIGDKIYDTDKDFKLDLTKHVNTQYKALLDNSNKTHIVDSNILNTLKGQFKAYKNLIRFLKDNNEILNSLPSNNELNLIESNIKLLELTNSNKSIRLNDIIRTIKDTGKALKREWENSSKTEEDKGTSMEYTVLDSKPNKQDIDQILKRLEEAGMIC